MEISPATRLTSGCGLLRITMELLQDPNDNMKDLNGRLRGFLEQVNRLQGTNRQLEAQIADWGMRSSSSSQDWSEQEKTVSKLRVQVSLFRAVHPPFALTLYP